MMGEAHIAAKHRPDYGSANRVTSSGHCPIVYSNWTCLTSWLSDFPAGNLRKEVHARHLDAKNLCS